MGVIECVREKNFSWGVGGCGKEDGIQIFSIRTNPFQDCRGKEKNKTGIILAGKRENLPRVQMSQVVAFDLYSDLFL